MTLIYLKCAAGTLVREQRYAVNRFRVQRSVEVTSCGALPVCSRRVRRPAAVRRPNAEGAGTRVPAPSVCVV